MASCQLYNRWASGRRRRVYDDERRAVSSVAQSACADAVNHISSRTANANARRARTPLGPARPGLPTAIAACSWRVRPNGIALSQWLVVRRRRRLRYDVFSSAAHPHHRVSTSTSSRCGIIAGVRWRAGRRAASNHFGLAIPRVLSRYWTSVGRSV